MEDLQNLLGKLNRNISVKLRGIFKQRGKNNQVI